MNASISRSDEFSTLLGAFVNGPLHRTSPTLEAATRFKTLSVNLSIWKLCMGIGVTLDSPSIKMLWIASSIDAAWKIHCTRADRQRLNHQHGSSLASWRWEPWRQSRFGPASKLADVPLIRRCEKIWCGLYRKGGEDFATISL